MNGTSQTFAGTKRLLPRVLLLLCMLVAIGLQSQPKMPELLKGIRIKELEFSPPKVDRAVFGKDTQLFLLPVTDLPMIDLRLYFAGGTNAEPIARAGSLAAMTRMLEIGGAGSRDGEAFQQALAALGTRLDIAKADEYWSISLRSLPSEFSRSVDLLEDLLLRARFPENELKVIQNAMLTGIKQRNNQPATIAARKLGEILYAGHRRGYSLQESDIRRLSIQELKENLERRLTTSSMQVSLTGQFETVDRERVERLLSLLPRTAPPKLNRLADAADPFEQSKYHGKILLVKKDAVQSAIVAGTLLPAHRHPDFYALQLCNQVLGGGSFNSRLMREIRVKRGLAYYAYSYNQFGAQAGSFVTSSATRLPTTAQTLNLMLQEVRGMQKDVTANELHLARESIINSLVFQFVNPTSYLDSEVRFHRHSMPADYLKNFPTKIRAVKPADVSRVAMRIDPSNLFIVVAGPESLRSDLEKIRPVIVVEPETLLHEK